MFVDFSGPENVAGLSRKRYGALFRNDFSRLKWDYSLDDKDAVVWALERSLVVTLVMERRKSFKLTMGTSSKCSPEVCDRHRIKRGFTTYDTPHLNGCAKRGLAMLEAPQLAACVHAGLLFRDQYAELYRHSLR